MTDTIELVDTATLVADLEERLQDPVRNRLQHPFVLAVERGEASKNQIAGWLHQFSLWADPSNKLFGVLWSNCPDNDIREMILENMLEEEKGMSSGLQGHMQLIGASLKALGWSAEDEANDTPRYQSWALRHWIEVVVRNRPFVQSISAVSFAMERINPIVFGKLEKGLREHYGLIDDELLAFSVHASDVEEEHGSLGPMAMERYAQTPSERQAVWESVIHTADLYYQQYNVWAEY
jgi:pyrroloquinoline-quinone synthase